MKIFQSLCHEISEKLFVLYKSNISLTEEWTKFI